MEEYQEVYNYDWRNINQEFWLKNIDETRNYIVE